MDVGIRFKAFFLWVGACVLAFFSACGDNASHQVNLLNERSYAYHYRNLDSTLVFAQRALKNAGAYKAGAAEAYNNLAFVALAKMQYNRAERFLEAVARETDNQVELLVANVQMMRLCQRRSRNKDFYVYLEQAQRRIRRVREGLGELDPHLRARYSYALTEYHIVLSTYLYYVGLTRQSSETMLALDSIADVAADTAQVLSYWYNIGSGGILTQGSEEERAEKEFDYLVRCYMAATDYGYPYWEAQALQGMSEHLENKRMRGLLVKNNRPAINYINSDQMPDSLLAGNLAQRSLNLFQAYGDIYQIAGANRTLAENYWQIGDYRSALICLDRALNEDPSIEQAPDLVASIREQLSLTYSAINNKPASDYNRNIYLDLQEQTRQDRMLEARASQLDKSSVQLNLMITAVVLMIILVITLLTVFAYMRKKSDARFSIEKLLEPLSQWQQRNVANDKRVSENLDEIRERMDIVMLHLQQNKRRNLEQRAKIQLVNSILPIIDRMVNEIHRAKLGMGDAQVQQSRYKYISELTDTINEYNNVLTQWIQMRQGELSLQIENFRLQSLFDTVSRGRMSFRLKGVQLKVEHTEDIVKADKTLTLFMINTMADNARKFTPEGGEVCVYAKEFPDSVEVSVSDNGCGMSLEKLSHIFDRTYTGGHGFGLKNCYGIIEKYKKTSRLFSVCSIGAESKEGQGTRVFFRLPKGIIRGVMLFFLASFPSLSIFTTTHPADSLAHPGRTMVTPRAVHKPTLSKSSSLRKKTDRAAQFADSAYYSNIKGTYNRTLQFADSCHKHLAPKDTLTLLDISNETAVAALALHKWELYNKSNSIYTKLFRQASADSTLPEYVRQMQRSETNKTVAVVLLVLLLIVLFPSYYFLYYRHVLGYRFCVDRIGQINKLLLSDAPDGEKLKGVDQFVDFRKFNLSKEEKGKLQTVVSRIKAALKASISNASQRQTSIELTKDELSRRQLENDRLHVSNSILDNCLSTLKHETMYYPSRIRQLIDGTDNNLDTISELATYYQELYRVLSEQAMRQISPARVDVELAQYLQSILKSLNAGESTPMETREIDGKYVDVVVDIMGCNLSEAQCQRLFTPNTVDLKFLLCKQIVREMGEATNLRACGIEAERKADGSLRLNIMMPKVYFDKEKNSKATPSC